MKLFTEYQVLVKFRGSDSSIKNEKTTTLTAQTSQRLRTRESSANILTYILNPWESLRYVPHVYKTVIAVLSYRISLIDHRGVGDLQIGLMEACDVTVKDP